MKTTLLALLITVLTSAGPVRADSLDRFTERFRAGVQAHMDAPKAEANPADTDHPFAQSSMLQRWSAELISEAAMSQALRAIATVMKAEKLSPDL
jgi:hypothetical protein